MGLFGKKSKEAAQPQPQHQPQQNEAAGMEQGLQKTRSGMLERLNRLFQFYTTPTDSFYEELEEALVLADAGVPVARALTQAVREQAKANKIFAPQEIRAMLQAEIAKSLPQPLPEEFPQLVLVVGVNGAGKTTALGKLAWHFAAQGKKVLLAAGDTFRAAAAEQLEEWAKRAGVQIVSHSGQADSAAVIFDAVSAGLARGADVILCDTAGRLQNKKNLMEELSKVSRTVDKKWSGVRRNYLVLDATTGQNGLSQAKEFGQAVGLHGIILTKLDGTAKGGVALAVCRETGLPIQYVGVGEKPQDLRLFSPAEYAEKFI